MKLMLQLDGGGVKGVIPSEVCAEIESYLNRPLYKVFNLISGTSTGAVLGSQLAAGVSAPTCRDLYVKKGADVFKARSKFNPFNWSKEKYDRKLVLDTMAESFEKNSETKKKNPLMSELKTKFMCTSVSVVDKKTHYFKNWEVKDGNLTTLDAVARSFAAPYYFGAINDPANKQVWLDGGTGEDNCTIRDCIIEAMRQDWLSEGVYILSLGCGYSNPNTSYDKASKMGWIGETKFYINLARKQSTNSQIFEAQELSKLTKGKILLDRLDIEIPEEWDELDAVKFIPNFSESVRRILPQKILEVVNRIKSVI